MARPAQQRIADGVRRLRARRAVDREDLGVEERVVAADVEAGVDAPRRRQLGAAGARVRDVVGAIAADCRQNVRPTEMIRSV